MNIYTYIFLPNLSRLVPTDSREDVELRRNQITTSPWKKDKLITKGVPLLLLLYNTKFVYNRHQTAEKMVLMTI